GWALSEEAIQSPNHERCFGRLKEYRRIATRYDKTVRNYLAMVKLGCIRLFYKRLCN
ncbi:transposase DDE domain protein, partial [Candidatus Erwinia dacicola]